MVITGPKTSLKINLPSDTKISIVDGKLKIEQVQSSLQGLVRTQVMNAITGVTTGWRKNLELTGTGYRANTNGKQLNLALGFSHPVVIEAPEGVTFEVVESKISVLGADRELVGLVASRIRTKRPADPYKLKGLKYEGEKIIKKAGKAAKTGAAGGK